MTSHRLLRVQVCMASRERNGKALSGADFSLRSSQSQTPLKKRLNKKKDCVANVKMSEKFVYSDFYATFALAITTEGV